MKTKKQGVLGAAIVVALALFAPALSSAGSLDPSAPPAPTMKTLDQIPPTWSQALPAAQRFDGSVLGGAAVLDKETGLVWEKSPSTMAVVFGSNNGIPDQVLLPTTWSNAVSICPRKLVGGRMGWRLPTIQELSSLSDGQSIPIGSPFTNVQTADPYWSATSLAENPSSAWLMLFVGPGARADVKTFNHSVWCVRGGQGLDAQ